VPVITFDALGEPVPQGSLRAFVHDGRAVITYGPRAMALGTWRGLIGAAALQAMEERDPFAGPLVIEAQFRFRRPASHYGARGVLPRYAAAIPGPDIDKVCRALLDALTGIVYRDDRQVAALMATKSYADPPGVSVRIDPTP
jgi:crossover junction endodeoxyribonuclease RusA